MKYTALQRHHGAALQLDGQTVDLFRTLSGAQRAARELDEGRAVLDPHKPVGCRVQPVQRASRPSVRWRLMRVAT